MSDMPADATGADRPYRCRHRLRVRWAEVDAQKVVFNGQYLTYVDAAVTEYWRALGLPFQQLLPRFGGDIVLRHATLDYRASARYDDWVEVAVRCERLGRSSLTMSGALFAHNRPLMDVELTYVWVDPASSQSKELPLALREWIQAYEAGESMVHVDLGTWAQLHEAAAQLRRQVFVAEQGVPEDEEWDEADATCIHAVARNHAGEAIATGRLLLPDDKGIARLGRMAVAADFRGSGVGRDVLHALLNASALRGDHQVVIHAQVSAQGFYSRSGFQARGERFWEAGIEHIEMSRTH